MRKIEKEFSYILRDARVQRALHIFIIININVNINIIKRRL